MILLNQMSWITHQSVEKLIISVNMHYQLFFKRYIGNEIGNRRS